MQDQIPAGPKRDPRGRRVRVERGIFRREFDPPHVWLVFWSADGRECSQAFRGSLAQARKLRESKRVDADRGELVAKTRITVDAVAEEYFAFLGAMVTRGERSQRTLEDYRASWRTHLKEPLGRRPIQSVTTAELSRLIVQLRSKRKVVNGKQKDELLSAWSIHNAVKVLRLLLRYAVRHSYLAVNPLDRIADELPAGRNRQPARVLEATDIMRLIEATPKGYRSLVALVAYTGIRISEALGLVWDDIDFDAGVIHVSRQLARVKKGESPKRLPLKTSAGARRIDVAPELDRILRDRRQEAFRRGHAKPDDFVFATLTGAPINHRNASARGLEKGAERAGLNREGLPKLGFHDLRHTAITHLIR